MADQLQLRGGTTSENLAFTGAQREVVVDTDRNSLRVHDGLTEGGFAVPTQSEITDGTYFFNDDVGNGSAANAYILSPKVNTNVPTAYEDGIVLGFVAANSNTGPSTADFDGLGVKNIKYPGGVDPSAGDISGRVTVVFDAVNDWFELQEKATGTPPQIRTVSASVGGNALSVSIGPAIIDFRSPTLGSGTVNTRNVTTSLNLVVPAGATLGTVNGVASRIAIIAVDDAGTVRPAVINLAGGVVLDEMRLINTSAINIGSSSPSTFYAASAISGVPFRVMGFVESTQAVAGTWQTVPSQIQGQGGQATIGVDSSLSLATAQNTTSGTAIDFTGIPSGVNRVTVMMNGVSLSGSSQLIIQVGTSSGVETTGYSSYGTRGGASTIAGGNSTSGFFMPTNSAAETHGGAVVLTRVTANTWVAQGAIAAPTYIVSTSGSKSLAGTLDRVRITSVNGTDLFDAGSVNISYEM